MPHLLKNLALTFFMTGVASLSTAAPATADQAVQAVQAVSYDSTVGIGNYSSTPSSPLKLKLTCGNFSDCQLTASVPINGQWATKDKKLKLLPPEALDLPGLKKALQFSFENLAQTPINMSYKVQQKNMREFFSKGSAELSVCHPFSIDNQKRSSAICYLTADVHKNTVLVFAPVAACGPEEAVCQYSIMPLYQE